MSTASAGWTPLLREFSGGDRFGPIEQTRLATLSTKTFVAILRRASYDGGRSTPDWFIPQEMSVSSPKSSRPTDAELEILNVLWEQGPSTVRQVHQALDKPTGYTTVLKLLQIMTEKSLVLRDESRRSHVYRARGRQQQVQKRLITDLLDRAFAGATDQLVQQALSARRLSAEEIDEIRQMLDAMEDDAS